jgi:biopolymer transport protein ExbD
MNIKNRRSRPSAEVHTAALNDIMFFLMLFFLLASAVANPQVVKLLLPKTNAGEQSVAKKTLVVSITDDLKFFIDKRQVTEDELLPQLQSLISPQEELTIMLYADRTVPIQQVLTVMSAANELGIRMVLATEPLKK